MKKKELVILFTVMIFLTTICQAEMILDENDLPYNIVLDQISGITIKNRQPAEFERMEGVLIRYPFGISYDLIAEMAENVEVITIVNSIDQQNNIEGLFENNDVDLNNCSFIIAPSNSYWTRDYGPWFIYNETDKEMKVVDFEYNRPRPNDNNIPYQFSVNQGLNYTFIDLIHTGGNYMTDGNGIAVSTQLVLDENPGKTEDEINQIMNQYLGIHTYHIRPDVNDEYIKHIDCWAKYLSPDTILIREVPSTHSQYQEIESAVEYFEMQSSCYDTPYNIVRVYTPNDEPYTNSLILNNKVFIPMQGTQWDDDAIETYEYAMPGYEIIGFYEEDNPWLSTDAIHCRVKGIPDRNMLYIDHFPLSGNNGFTVKTRIIPYSGESVKDVSLYWKIEGLEWNQIQMNNIGNSMYESYIPLQEYEEKVYYYIEAQDNSGRIEKHPFMGEYDPHSFIVNNLPPTTPEIVGQNEGKVETEYEFTFTSSDPEENMVSYYINWGDGNITTWTDFQISDSPFIESHSWNEQGVFTIKAKSKDTLGAESEYSTTQVSLPKNKGYFDLLIHYLENHIFLFPLLRFILMGNI